MNRFQEIIDMQTALTEKLKTFGEGAIAEHFTPFFEANPAIDGAIWSQYTPYFNDGDACTFSVGEYHLVSKSIATEFGETERIYIEDYMHEHAVAHAYKKEAVPALEAAEEAFSLLWNEIPCSILEAVFGDHVRVFVGRDKTVEVEEYEHD